jgi:tRNA (guanine37-N1)-methyltransferase
VAGGLIDVRIHDIREHATDPHQTTDDYAFGGGPGMVMKPEPVFESFDALGPGARRTILLSPAGRRLDQRLVRELAAEPWLVLICGRYEGVDERVAAHLVDREISIGDYVLSGGELAAMVVIDAVSRLVAGVLGCAESPEDESFAEHLLEYPHYTRPPVFEGHAVPDVLLSGHHAEIERWRRDQAMERTRRRRPDLLAPEG